MLQGKKVLVMENTACKAGERTIVRNFWYEFAPGERIGIVGPNGAGKSSLLDMITGDRRLAGGHREVGETTALGYFRQHVPDVKPTLKIIDYIRCNASPAILRLCCRSSEMLGLLPFVHLPQALRFSQEGIKNPDTSPQALLDLYYCPEKVMSLSLVTLLHPQELHITCKCFAHQHLCL